VQPPLEDDLPQRRHLRRLDRIWVRQPIYLVTICTVDRRELLLPSTMATATVDCLQVSRLRHGWLVGHYVLMPDHIHFLCTRADGNSGLSTFVDGFKQATTRPAWDLGRRERLWQREFHDHLLRSPAYYREKSEYIRQNPVRRGLCAAADDWPWSGVMDMIGDGG
jgi:REP element-mobilizing transposase RayT